MLTPRSAPTPADDDDSQRVLVFDSGAGVLSIGQHVANSFPSVSLLLASDNAGHPYGAMDERALVARVARLLDMWCERHAPAVAIVACNTASTAALPTLRARLRVPVIGVVPAIKPAARLSASGVITLLATPATIKREYMRGLIAKHAAGATVFSLASMELVEIAERKLRGAAVVPGALARILAPLSNDPLALRSDVVVLGCTHFHLLREELGAACPRPVRWLDSTEAISRRLAAVLPEPRAALARPVHRALFSNPGDPGIPAFLSGLRAAGLDCEAMPEPAPKPGAETRPMDASGLAPGLSASRRRDAGTAIR